MGFFSVRNNTEFRVLRGTSQEIKFSDDATALPPTPIPQVQLSNFSVTTTSGTILVNWGDGLSDTLSSGIPINHSYICPGSPAVPGFWNGIQPCI
jgi:hypothetical protein